MITDLNPNRGQNPNETYGNRKRTYDVHTAASLAENSVRSKGAKTTPNVHSQRKPKKTSDFARLVLAGLGAIAILGVLPLSPSGSSPDGEPRTFFRLT